MRKRFTRDRDPQLRRMREVDLRQLPRTMLLCEEDLPLRSVRGPTHRYLDRIPMGGSHRGFAAFNAGFQRASLIVRTRLVATFVRQMNLDSREVRGKERNHRRGIV